MPQCRLRRGKPCDRHPERRARDVSKARFIEKSDRSWITSVLAADTNFYVRPRCMAACGRDFDEFADALLVDRSERIRGQDSLGYIFTEERSGIVARKGKAGLGQVIGAERKELGGLGEFAGS